MRQYSTRQRQALLAYLTEHPQVPLSAEALCEGVSRRQPISVSAVYRNLAKLAEDGEVRKVPGEDGKTVLYQYADHAKCSSHLHMQCSGCGRVLHMDEAVSALMVKSLQDSSGFQIDRGKTILYGKCSDCR